MTSAASVVERITSSHRRLAVNELSRFTMRRVRCDRVMVSTKHDGDLIGMVDARWSRAPMPGQRIEIVQWYARPSISDTGARVELKGARAVRPEVTIENVYADGWSAILDEVKETDAGTGLSPVIVASGPGEFPQKTVETVRIDSVDWGN